MGAFSRQSGVVGMAVRDRKDWEGRVGRNQPERERGRRGRGGGRAEMPHSRRGVLNRVLTQFQRAV